MERPLSGGNISISCACLNSSSTHVSCVIIFSAELQWTIQGYVRYCNAVYVRTQGRGRKLSQDNKPELSGPTLIDQCC